ncbi:MAG: PQQ-binding-like beta-propeller repeat protein [Planctomycetota bacterium]
MLKAWPEGGPKLAWSYKASGTGYSACAVSGGRVYTLGAQGEDTFCVCLESESGKELWKTNVGRASVLVDYNLGWGGGPRSTPTVDGNDVFATTDLGIVFRINRQTGELIWKADLVGDFNGKVPTWGYSDSPLIDGDRVIVTPGGDNFMVALDRSSGKKVWGSVGVSEIAQYVSIMKGKVDNQDFYLTANKSGLLAVSPLSGEKLFGNDATGNDVAVVPTPVIFGDYVYHTSAYNAGNVLLSLKASDSGIDSEELYHETGKTMLNHHGGVVLVDGVIYGTTKAESGAWMAQDVMTGEVLWSHKIGRNKSGSIAYADGRLYCYNDRDGSCYLVEPSRDGFQSKGSVALPQQTDIPRNKGAIWAHPVVADGKLIIRDQDLIFAFDVSE